MPSTLQSKSLVLALVRASNPNLPLPLLDNDVRFGIPEDIVTPSGSIVNTQVALFPKHNSGYIGKTKVKYRRINLTTLFRSIAPILYVYSNKPVSMSPFTLYQLLPHLNKKYGLGLTEDDVVSISFPIGNITTPGFLGVRTSTVKITTKPTSLAYVGSITLRWVYTEQTLPDMTPIYEIPGREFPGGNVFNAAHERVINSLGFGIDFTAVEEYFAEINNFSGLFLIGHPSFALGQQAVLDYLNLYTGMNFTVGQAFVDEPMNLYGATTKTYVLPHADVSEANSNDFNRAIVIIPKTGVPLAKIAGKLILHYNA